ncbi:hypothetical protein EIP91_003703 [Steccherinum ochraceum]|uniref:CCHC-type domain-containing protein n=1 Tax=Steccherinum ochraceum TaxID=92696 RepID=A0A4R0RNV0_9APHY|nr:hypothetical protein EIP91_003703 [Steccherinum ochraceum]
MTRFTNVGRKRTYVQAGFDHSDHDSQDSAAVANGPTSDHTPTAESSSAPQRSSVEKDAPEEQEKKKRRRRRKAQAAEQDVATATAEGAVSGAAAVSIPNTKKTGWGRDPNIAKRAKDADARKFASERRRVQRQQDRNADTTCFACREKGHAARDCPKALASEGGTEGGKRPKQNRSVVGICYRCGSKRHNLSRCREPVDPANPLPFASCFVCSGSGHLAGSCPKNGDRGVYPNGGSCKLCGQTTHLAKDCDLRKQDVAVTKLFVGTGQEVGADEDDFHSFKRRTAEVNREEKGEDKMKRMQAVKQGAHSGVVKAFGQAPSVKPRKVVAF